MLSVRAEIAGRRQLMDSAAMTGYADISLPGQNYGYRKGLIFGTENQAF